MFRWHYTEQNEYPKHDGDMVFCRILNYGCLVLEFFKDGKGYSFIDNKGKSWNVCGWCYEEDICDMLDEMTRFFLIHSYPPDRKDEDNPKYGDFRRLDRETNGGDDV